MIIDQYVLPTMIAAAIAGGVVVVAQIVGVFRYDTAEVKRQRAMRLHPNARVYRQRPLITALVSSHNDPEAIRRTLDSILRSRYRNVEVIVVDHASTDMTKQLVKGYADMYPKRAIRLVARRVERGKYVSLVRAMKRYGNGQLVMTLPAGSVVNEETFLRATRHFAYDAGLEAIKCIEQINSSLHITGLFEKYHALLGRRTDKFLSAFGWMGHPGRVAMYRADAFPLRLGKRPRVRYAHDVAVTVPAFDSYAKSFGYSYRAYIQSLRLSVGWYRGSLAHMTYALCSAIVSMSGPLLAAYFLYVALYLHEPTLLLLAVAGLSAFLLVAIGETRLLKRRQKAAYAFGVPMMYALFYLLSFSRLLAVLTAPFAKQLTDERRTV